ncbi:MAG: hypothetical protein VX794_06500 [Nitrospinota bacterium]|nr:hypothetical protein [Nitrospinota bacterium]
MFLEDKIQISEPGTLVHIPKNTPHCAMTIDNSTKFFSVKSPSGNGKLVQDFVQAENHEEILHKLSNS